MLENFREILTYVFAAMFFLGGFIHFISISEKEKRLIASDGENDTQLMVINIIKCITCVVCILWGAYILLDLGKIAGLVLCVMAIICVILELRVLGGEQEESAESEQQK